MKAAGLIFIALWLAVIVGWIMNIVSIVHAVNLPITGMFILRCIGIFVFPVGGILGYF